MKRAFTLIELLVVIAIIAILAAILFPVFAQAKGAAKKTADISNFKQWGTGVALYTADTDGGLPLSNSGGTGIPGWGYGPPDTVPGQQMAQYMKNRDVFICPLDPVQGVDNRIRMHAQEMGWSAPYSEEQKGYASGVRANTGYNYAFLSPWRYIQSTGEVTSASINESEIGATSSTIMFGTSIWYRDGGGNPTGAGNWVVEPPCWEDQNDVMLQPMKRYQDDGTLQTYTDGWKNPTATIDNNSWLVYGGLWPFHNQTSLANIQPGLRDGHVITGMVDTSVKSRPVKSLTEGCTAYGTANRKGKVTDFGKYLWDLQ